MRTKVPATVGRSHAERAVRPVAVHRGQGRWPVALLGHRAHQPWKIRRVLAVREGKRRTRRRVSTQAPPFPVIPFSDQAEMPAGSPGGGPSRLPTPQAARTRHRYRVGPDARVGPASDPIPTADRPSARGRVAHQEEKVFWKKGQYWDAAPGHRPRQLPRRRFQGPAAERGGRTRRAVPAAVLAPGDPGRARLAGPRITLQRWRAAWSNAPRPASSRP